MKFDNAVLELLNSDKRKRMVSHIFERQLVYFIENKYGWLMDNHDQTLRRKAMRMHYFEIDLTRYKCDKADSMLEIPQSGMRNEGLEAFMVRGKVYQPVMGNSIGQGRISNFYPEDQKDEERAYSPYKKLKHDLTQWPESTKGEHEAHFRMLRKQTPGGFGTPGIIDNEKMILVQRHGKKMVTDRRHLQVVGSLPFSVLRPISILPQSPSGSPVNLSGKAPLDSGQRSLSPPKRSYSTSKNRTVRMDTNISLATAHGGSNFFPIKPNLAKSFTDQIESLGLTAEISRDGPITKSYKRDQEVPMQLLLLSGGKGPWKTPSHTKTPTTKKSPIDWATLKYIKLNYTERFLKRNEYLQTLVDCYRVKADV
jgi:hypothetical protein